MTVVSFGVVPSWYTTNPELTGFITRIVPDFLDVRSVCFLFILRDISERNASYIKDPVTL